MNPLFLGLSLIQMKVLAFILIFQFMILGQEEKFSKVQLNEQISVRLPKSFSPMTMEDQKQRVKSHRKALALYTDESRYVEFGANISYSKFASEDLELLKDFYKVSLMHLFTDIEFHRDEIININGRDFVAFEFTSTVKEKASTYGESLSPINKYTYITYTLAHGNTYLFNFTCPIRLRTKWQSVADQVMRSIQIIDK